MHGVFIWFPHPSARLQCQLWGACTFKKPQFEWSSALLQISEGLRGVVYVE